MQNKRQNHRKWMKQIIKKQPPWEKPIKRDAIKSIWVLLIDFIASLFWGYHILRSKLLPTKRKQAKDIWKSFGSFSQLIFQKGISILQNLSKTPFYYIGVNKKILLLYWMESSLNKNDHHVGTSLFYSKTPTVKRL